VTDRQIGRQAGRQTDRQTDKPKGRQIHVGTNMNSMYIHK